MTEAEWLTCADPTPMLAFLRGQASGRKLRLFAVACCRHVWRFFTDERSRRAVEVNERYLRGEATLDDVTRAAAAVQEAMQKKWGEVCEARRVADSGGRDAPFFFARAQELEAEFTTYWIAEQLGKVDVSLTAGLAAWGVAWSKVATGQDEKRFQSDLLRDLIPDPFRPPDLGPAPLPAPVLELARAIDESADFAALPALADALERAGCPSASLLSHCRGAGPHARGCWALDLILGRA
jgi:hypothetical protein